MTSEQAAMLRYVTVSLAHLSVGFAGAPRSPSDSAPNDNPRVLRPGGYALFNSGRVAVTRRNGETRVDIAAARRVWEFNLAA